MKFSKTNKHRLLYIFTIGAFFCLMFMSRSSDSWEIHNSKQIHRHSDHNSKGMILQFLKLNCSQMWGKKIFIYFFYIPKLISVFSSLLSHFPVNQTLWGVFWNKSRRPTQGGEAPTCTMLSVSQAYISCWSTNNILYLHTQTLLWYNWGDASIYFMKLCP